MSWSESSERSSTPGRRPRWRLVAAGVSLVLAAVAAPPAVTAQPADGVAELYRRSLEAYRAGDHAGFVAATRDALELAPDHPRLIYNLACGEALGGAPRPAVRALGRLADMGLAFDLAADADLASLTGRRGFRRVARRMERLRQPVGTARRALALDDGGFLPEGVAHDPATGALFVGGVHRRHIVRAVPGAAPATFAGPEDGLWGVFGLAVDAPRRRLWACTSAVPQMAGAAGDRAAEAGRAALLLFDLGEPPAAGRLAGRYPLPAAESERVCNDLAVGPAGEVYVADSRSGALLWLPPGGEALAELLPPGRLRSPNGLAVAAGGRRLYVSDYPEGLYAVELPAAGGGPPALHRLDHPPDVMLRGIDGLARHGADLVAVQNAYRPHRVVRLSLTADGRSVRRAEVLLAGHPDFDEPTLGTVAGDRYLLVANSHWNRVDEDGALPPAGELAGPVVLEVELE